MLLSLPEAATILGKSERQIRYLIKLHILDDEAYLAFVDQGDKLGRQLGGWLRRLHEAP